MTASPDHAAHDLAARCLDFKAESLPPPVEHEARRALLDTFGCILLGASESGLPRLSPGIASPDSPSARVLGFHRAVPPREAMIHHARLAQIHDANDGHTLAAARRSLGHPGRVVIPAAWAEAQSRGHPLDELLAAVTAGYEFGCRALPAVSPLNLDPLGPLAALARLRRVHPDQLLVAAGLALPLAPQTLALGWANHTHHNFLRCGASVGAAWDALAAAEAGMRGPDLSSIEAARLLTFEGPPHPDDFALTGRYTKPFPSCRMTHGAIECALTLQRKHAIDAIRITKIDAWVVPGGLYVSDRTLHDDFKRRAFSLPVCVSLALHFGALTPDHLRNALPPVISQLAARTEVHEDQTFLEIYPHRGRPSRLRLTLLDGSVLEHRIDVPLGEPARPESDQALVERFVLQGRPLFPACSLHTFARCLLDAPLNTPVRDLSDLLP